MPFHRKKIFRIPPLAPTTSEDQLPILEWHAQVLAEDAARYQKNPTEGASWPEVKARLLRNPRTSLHLKRRGIDRID